MIIKDDIGTIHFPYTDTANSDYAQLGMIIELKVNKDKKYEWINHSLVRQFFPDSLKSILNQNPDIFTITADDLATSDAQIMLDTEEEEEVKYPELFTEKEFEKIVAAKVDTLQNSEYIKQDLRQLQAKPTKKTKIDEKSDKKNTKPMTDHDMNNVRQDTANKTRIVESDLESSTHTPNSLTDHLLSEDEYEEEVYYDTTE